MTVGGEEDRGTTSRGHPADQGAWHDRELLLAFCLDRLDAVTALVAAMDDENANWRPHNRVRTRPWRCWCPDEHVFVASAGPVTHALRHGDSGIPAPHGGLAACHAVGPQPYGAVAALREAKGSSCPSTPPARTERTRGC